MKQIDVHLYYREGSSDKVYHAHLVKSGERWVVAFEYGRRGSTLQAGTKTNAPVDYDSALKIFNKLVAEKKAKGYTEDTGGAAYVGTERQDQVSGILPQLLNAIDEDAVPAFIKSERWWMQEKIDGKRMLLRKEEGKVEAINRKGLLVRFPQAVYTAAMKLRTKSFVIDGEIVGDTLYAFDLLEVNGNNLIRKASYSHRYGMLQDILQQLRAGDAFIYPITSWVTEEAKTEALAWLRSGRAEGVVFKDSSAPYTVGRPNSGGAQLKYKFTATCSAIVTSVKTGKRSVALEVLNGAERVAIGNVTIPANHAIPKAGEIVEVRYLYAYRGGALFQPVYLGARDDIDRDACTLAQLKFKAETADDDDR